MSIFKDTIKANTNWGIPELSSDEKINVVREQFKRARLEIDEAEAAFERFIYGKTVDGAVVEEMADVCIFMQTACFAMTGKPIDSMIEHKSAVVLDRNGVWLGGSFVKEKDLKAVFGEDSCKFSISNDQFKFFNSKTISPTSIKVNDAAEQVREWMENREL